MVEWIKRAIVAVAAVLAIGFVGAASAADKGGAGKIAAPDYLAPPASAKNWTGFSLYGGAGLSGTEIAGIKIGDEWVSRVMSEDWLFGYDLHQMGLKVMATRKIKICRF